jgi:hypothetical protein
MTQTRNGGTGTVADPYFHTEADYPYRYKANQAYYNTNGQRFNPSQDEIDAGFVHLYSNYYSRTQPAVTGVKLLDLQIKTIEQRLEQDQKDLAAMQKAKTLLTDNPEYVMLLELHNRGLL